MYATCFVCSERFTFALARFHEADTPYLEFLKCIEATNHVGERAPGVSNFQVKPLQAFRYVSLFTRRIYSLPIWFLLLVYIHVATAECDII